MPITLDRRAKGTCPFEVFHTALGSTLCTEFELESDLTVENILPLEKVRDMNKRNKAFVTAIGRSSETEETNNRRWKER
jgi:hypothetical protein